MDQDIEDYRQTVEIDEREFQRISIDRSIYPIPIDEVSKDSQAQIRETVWPNAHCSIRFA